MRNVLPWILAGLALAIAAVALPRLARPDRSREEADERTVPAARVFHPTRATVLALAAADGSRSTGGRYEAELDRWLEILASVGVAARLDVLSDGMAMPEPSDVLVLPFATCLEEYARAVVRAHLQAGGGLVLVGDSGERDGSCLPAGPGLLAELVGEERPMRLEEGAAAAVQGNGGPLAFGLPRDLRLELNSGSRFALAAAGGDARYDAPRPAIAAQHYRAGHGNVSWLGFGLSTVPDSAAQRRIAALLVRNAVAWAAGHPIRFLALNSVPSAV